MSGWISFFYSVDTNIYIFWLLCGCSSLKKRRIRVCRDSKTAVELCLLWLLTETEMWQLVCISLWEIKWMCFMGTYFIFFSSEEVFIIYFTVSRILWHVCRFVVIWKCRRILVQESKSLFCCRMKVVEVRNFGGVFVWLRTYSLPIILSLPFIVLRTHKQKQAYLCISNCKYWVTS